MLEITNEPCTCNVAVAKANKDPGEPGEVGNVKHLLVLGPAHDDVCHECKLYTDPAACPFAPRAVEHNGQKQYQRAVACKDAERTANEFMSRPSKEHVVNSVLGAYHG